jgi:glucans biosynthesis protein
MTGDQPAQSHGLPMHLSPRCGARTRKGTPCLAPAVKGKRRCRMHGGAKGSGAPKGNQNALKHGLYTRQAIEERRQLRRLVTDSRKTLKELA